MYEQTASTTSHIVSHYLMTTVCALVDCMCWFVYVCMCKLYLELRKHIQNEKSPLKQTTVEPHSHFKLLDPRRSAAILYVCCATYDICCVKMMTMIIACYGLW